MTDEELVIQLKENREGKKEAFDELYYRYKDLAIRNAYLITGNRSDAEDVVQEAFVTSYLHIGELKNYSGYKAWLMQILIRLSYRTAKRCKREFPEEHTEEIREQRELKDVMQHGSAERSSPLAQLITREEADRVMTAVNTLPAKQRVVIVLYYYDELSVEEIASIVRISTGTVKSRLFAARKNLKHLLEQEEAGVMAHQNFGRERKGVTSI
ncbi:MAG: RNA polymerase sigma factor [Lachnospiraceae bacterium]|nr:RNA polymerase sigma factor [Lachnospiraceae bacterium]